jgi:hypothetical protein
MGFLGAVRPYSIPDVLAPAVPLPPTRMFPRAE